MIAIKNIDDRAAKTVCEQLSLPLCDVLEMVDGTHTLGMACVECDGEEATLHYLEAPDVALTDALLRAALNVAMAQGAVSAQILPESLQNHMLQKGYMNNTACSAIKIAEFFAKRCCNG